MGEKAYSDNIKKGTDLVEAIFKTNYIFYSFLTPQMSKTKRFSEFAYWQGIDGRTAKKYLKGEKKGEKLTETLKLSDNRESIKDSLDFFESEHLWKYLEGRCEICEWRGAEECEGKAPANGCVYYCRSCKRKDSCEQNRGTKSKVPEDCKILAYDFERVDNAVALPYFFLPLEYTLSFRNSEMMEDNEVLSILNDLIEVIENSLGKILGDNFNIDYISCIIRYAYLYNLIDHLRPTQEGVEPTENPITWMFAYSRRSLSISRIYNEKVLEDILKQIVTDSIDDRQVELWKRCIDFEKDLLKSQESPKPGSVGDLLEYAKEDTSIADIVIFLSHFADITLSQLRPIDIKILQKCLCWKEYSFEQFFKKLPQLPEHLEEWFSKK